MMYAAAVEFGVLALTQQVIIVVITKMFFLLVIKVRAIKLPDILDMSRHHFEKKLYYLFRNNDPLIRTILWIFTFEA